MPRYTSRNEKFTFGVGVSAVYVNDNAPNLTLTTGSTTMSSRGEGLNYKYHGVFYYISISI